MTGATAPRPPDSGFDSPDSGNLQFWAGVDPGHPGTGWTATAIQGLVRVHLKGPELLLSFARGPERWAHVTSPRSRNPGDWEQRGSSALIYLTPEAAEAFAEDLEGAAVWNTPIPLLPAPRPAPQGEANGAPQWFDGNGGWLVTAEAGAVCVSVIIPQQRTYQPQGARALAAAVRAGVAHLGD